jgi:hypothetical protein
MNAPTARKDIPVSAGLDAATNELLDQLAAMQAVSHAESVRRAIHLLAAHCGLYPAPSGGQHWAIRE